MIEFKFYIEQRNDLSYYYEMREWLDSNCTKKWQWHSSTDTIVFWDDEDALAFKLKYWDFQNDIC